MLTSALNAFTEARDVHDDACVRHDRPAPAPEYERYADTEARTGVSARTWRRFVKTRRIPVYRIGRMALLKKADVDAFLEARRHEAVEQPNALKAMLAGITAQVRAKQREQARL